MAVERDSETTLTPRQEEAMDYVHGIMGRPYAMFIQPDRYSQEQVDQALVDYESLFGISREEKLEAMKKEEQMYKEKGTDGIIAFLKEDFSKRELLAMLKACDGLIQQEGPIPPFPEL